MENAFLGPEDLISFNHKKHKLVRSVILECYMLSYIYTAILSSFLNVNVHCLELFILFDLVYSS